jgi:hypothetical protein
MTTILISGLDLRAALDYSEAMRKITFPEEPLDTRDRKLIQTICTEGGKGIGFNRLVERAKPFASRSTVAVRMERLMRLGYLERNSGDKGQGKERPIRPTYKCFSLMLSIDKAKEVAARLRAEIETMRKAESLGKEELRRWWVGFRERYNSLFGLVGTMAIFYGTSAAGDLFLPFVVEDYKMLATGFMQLVRERPALLKSVGEIIDERAVGTGIDLEEMRKMQDELLDPVIYRFREWGSEGDAYS